MPKALRPTKMRAAAAAAATPNYPPGTVGATVKQRKKQKWVPYAERVPCPHGCGSRFMDQVGVHRHLLDKTQLGCGRGVQQRKMRERGWTHVDYVKWLHFVRALGIDHEVAVPFRVTDRRRHADGLGPDSTAGYAWNVWVPGWVGGVARLSGIKRVTKEVWIRALKADPKLLAALDTLTLLENRPEPGQPNDWGRVSLVTGWRLKVTPSMRTLMNEYLKNAAAGARREP